MLEIPKGRPIVDPCAGEGAIVEWLAANNYEAYGVEIDGSVAGDGIVVGDWFRVSGDYIPRCNVVATPPTMLVDKFIESTLGCEYAAYLCVPSVSFGNRPNRIIDAGLVNDTPMQWRIFTK